MYDVELIAGDPRLFYLYRCAREYYLTDTFTFTGGPRVLQLISTAEKVTLPVLATELK